MLQMKQNECGDWRIYKKIFLRAGTADLQKFGWVREPGHLSEALNPLSRELQAVPTMQSLRKEGMGETSRLFIQQNNSNSDELLLSQVAARDHFHHLWLSLIGPRSLPSA